MKTPPIPTPPKVFISYSHDTPEHEAAVLSYSDHLRERGIDCNIDQYQNPPSEGWTQWMLKQVKQADYILIVCTDTYRRRFEGEEAVGVGQGAKWEGLIINQNLYDSEGNDKFIPVVFSPDDVASRPTMLKGTNYYDLSKEMDRLKLYRRLTNQPEIKRPDIGKIQPLPLREVKQLFHDSYESPQSPAESQPTHQAQPVNTAAKIREQVNQGGVQTSRLSGSIGVESPYYSATLIEIRLLLGEIDEIHLQKIAGTPIDAISVGQYKGIVPIGPVLALDRSLSTPLPGKTSDNIPSEELHPILTRYIGMGIFGNELGQVFFLPDPRGEVTVRKTAATDRVIAIAGLGMPGRFGVPELTVMSRALCWSLGQIGKRHLATVLIGSGSLSIQETVAAWIAGIKAAFTLVEEDSNLRIRQITFVEIDPYKIEEIEKAILQQQRLLQESHELTINYKPLGRQELAAIYAFRLKWDRQLQQKNRYALTETLLASLETRLMVAMSQKTFRLSAIVTGEAVLPERTIPFDADLVMTANDGLAAAASLDIQVQKGRFLGQLLFPDDFRQGLRSNAPLTILVDPMSARIHWEMVVLSDSSISNANQLDVSDFLGTSRGVTRQLSTIPQLPPEPPPPPRRILRVLVIANPAEGELDLPGAQAEGERVADLFESFNLAYEGLSENRVEVVRLFGARATRTEFLQHLMLRQYNVLHFAGHCIYDRDDPASSGWVLAGGQRWTANEMNKIDRMPKFVFSNASESGIMSYQAQENSSDPVPGFAESFLVRGVSNFVCTAWPIDDAAAQEFALKLYAGLLGLSKVEDQHNQYSRIAAKPMYEAMRASRVAIATGEGLRSWGAYQHYGNPFYSFFNMPAMSRQMPAISSRKSSRKGKSTRAATKKVRDEAHR